jgi:hypothetical protein
VWGINKDVVRNPHWIYPGDVLILDLTGATPRLRLEGAPDGGLSRWYGYVLQVSNLSPQMRSQPIAFAIPTISAKAIDPFLIRPLIVNPSQVAAAPKIVANVDKRVVVSAGDTAYVMGLDRKSSGGRSTARAAYFRIPIPRKCSASRRSTWVTPMLPASARSAPLKWSARSRRSRWEIG